MITAYVSIKPGVMEQKMFIENQETHSIDTISCSLDNLPVSIMNYKPNKIILNGSVNFTDKIEKDIKELELTKYGHNEVEIIKGDIF